MEAYRWIRCNKGIEMHVDELSVALEKLKFDKIMSVLYNNIGSCLACKDTYIRACVKYVITVCEFIFSWMSRSVAKKLIIIIPARKNDIAKIKQEYLTTVVLRD